MIINGLFNSLFLKVCNRVYFRVIITCYELTIKNVKINFIDTIELGCTEKKKLIAHKLLRIMECEVCYYQISNQISETTSGINSTTLMVLSLL